MKHKVTVFKESGDDAVMIFEDEPTAVVQEGDSGIFLLSVFSKTRAFHCDWYSVKGFTCEQLDETPHQTV